MNLQHVIDSGVAVAVNIAMLDRVTFQRPTVTTDTAGGHTQSPNNTTPTSIPCVIEPTSTGPRMALMAQLGNKIIKGTIYTITIPSQYGSAVVDVDSTCNAVVAARGTESPKTLHVHGVGRIAGAIIEVLASREE